MNLIELMSPAEIVIEAFGGIRATARITKRDPSSVSRWRLPKNKKGLGGNVPAGVQRVILEEAERRGLPITAQDLIVGR